ncbi:MAG: hypothetical protein D3924_07440, partial [Candidatus Electrothrix sp. AR4]|nr:hypothetical protein [Candidatus Electrothrix sp. AR4]
MPPSTDEFEDLTQFADESFDTDEVDLFEFTDNDDSPLLRLKSIVLSLDWDITEETLAELTEELASLRSLWDGDKVAQIYLQGLENIGKYLQTEGAYAHPNAIKLLLTLFYNYEKIISSTDISGETITAMLKADIRKFKVLQYQIGTVDASSDDSSVPADTDESEPHKVENVAEQPKEGNGDPINSMEATILGLEWEVTHEGLEKFNQEAIELRKYLSDNNDAQVLVQGLQALGSYIREEKTNAHPDSFTILHAFYDALKLLLQDTNLTAEQRKQILVDQISSLNSLKAIIAKSAAGTSPLVEKQQHAEAAEHSIELESESVDEDQDLSAPDEESPLSDDEVLTFDFDEDELDEDQDLSSSDEESSLSDDEVLTFDFDEDELDFDLSDEELEDNPSVDSSVSDNQADEEFFLDSEATQPVAAEVADDLINEELSTNLDTEEDLGGDIKPEESSEDSLELDIEDEGLLDFDDDLFLDENNQKLTEEDDTDELVTPALADADEGEGFNDDFTSAGIGEEKAAELDEKLDSFFDFDDDKPGDAQKPEAFSLDDESGIQQEKEGIAASSADDKIASDDVGEPDDLAASFFDFAEESEEDSQLETDSLEMPPSTDLVDVEEESLLEGEEDLDSFFNFDTDESEKDSLQEAVVVERAEDASDSSGDELNLEGAELEEEEDGHEIAVALADADESGGFSEDDTSIGLDGAKAAELDEKLNSFFDFGDDEQQQNDNQTESEDKSFVKDAEEHAIESDDDSVVAALSDDEESSVEDLSDVSPLLESGSDNKNVDELASFFDLDDELEGEQKTEGTVRVEEIDELDDAFVIALDGEESATAVEAAEPTLALEDEDEDGFDDSVFSVPSDESGEDQLDSFFELDDVDDALDDGEKAEVSFEAEEDEDLDDAFVIALDGEESATAVEVAEPALALEDEDGFDDSALSVPSA